MESILSGLLGERYAPNVYKHDVGGFDRKRLRSSPDVATFPRGRP